MTQYFGSFVLMLCMWDDLFINSL